MCKTLIVIALILIFANGCVFLCIENSESVRIFITDNDTPDINAKIPIR